MKYILFLFIISSTLFAEEEEKKVEIESKKVEVEDFRLRDIEPNKEFFNSLQSIRDELENREEAAILKENSLSELKKEILELQKEIEKYENMISANIKSFSTDESDKISEKIVKLMNVFDTMKAKNVAKIAEEMDESLLVAVLTRLKEERVGEIFKYLTPKKAAKLSELITMWKQRYLLDKNKKSKVDTNNKSN
ncbi:hypothetical protein JXR93_05585 [bacterium]|nr:hypothetical protein [bacterium]